ncbi:hypothetical protein [Labedella gwakjiensis]|nr:hypothetical protein [Labedella gwakjiensis]
MTEQQTATGVLEPAQLLAVMIRAGVAIPQLDGIARLSEDGRESIAF